jgi:predicted ATP-dependent endonuclease of OLD family
MKEAIFPNTRNLTREINYEINKSIFHGASVILKTTGMRKQIYLDLEGNSLPFMAWSAGQREFMPLLLSFYWLTYIKKPKKRLKDNELEWIVIEEPEMGLHPQAILSVILMCLELLNQDYKLIISTHSPVLLEAVWVIRFLKIENPDIKYLYQLFNLEPSLSITALFKNILKNKTFSTYHFDQQKDGVYVKDISSLDPGDLDDAIADWGGLTSFSSRASEVVSQAVQEKA